MVKVEIISTVKTAQTQNGLRHNDYLRYRRYCAKRLRRLREAVDFMLGRGKFEHKEITPEQCQDPRFLQMLLFNSERAWAYAMQLRQHLSSSISSKTKRHLLTRLRKAVKWADKLEECINSVGDVKSTLEGQAYRAMMTGNLYLEEQAWESARDQFLAAQAVLGKLREVADSIEVVGINEKLTHLEPMIMYCQHQLGNEVSTEELLALRYSQTPEAQLLDAQIESLLAEARQQKLQSAGEITFRDKTYTVKNEKARTALQKAEEVFLAMQKVHKKLDMYTEAFAHFDEAIKWIKKEKDEKASLGDIGEANVWGQLLEAVQQMKKSRIVERNLHLAELSIQKFDSSEVDSVIKGTKPKGKPQEIVKIYDTILNSVRELGDQEKENEIRGIRAYYMALVHLYNDKLLEAYALLQRCAELNNTSHEVRELMVKLQAGLAIRGSPPDISNLSLTEQTHLFPPSLEPVQCKPVFFDLAFDSIEYPNLQDRIKPKGIFSTIKGFFGR